MRSRIACRDHLGWWWRRLVGCLSCCISIPLWSNSIILTIIIQYSSSDCYHHCAVVWVSDSNWCLSIRNHFRAVHISFGGSTSVSFSGLTISFRSLAPLTFKNKSHLRQRHPLTYDIFKMTYSKYDIFKIFCGKKLTHRPHSCLLRQIPVVPQHLWVGLKYFHSAKNLFTRPNCCNQPKNFQST